MPAGSQRGGPPGKLVAWGRWVLDADGIPGQALCRDCPGTCGDTCPRPPLLPENKPLADLFLAMATQGAYTDGVLLGWRYADLAATAQMLGVKVDREGFLLLRDLERLTVAEADRLRGNHG